MPEPINGGDPVVQTAPAPVQPEVQQPVAVAPEPVAPVAMPQAPAPVAAPAQPAPLPDDAADRTRQQFEKLIESNRRLFEQNEALRRQTEQQAIARTQQQPQVNPNDFVFTDPNTGEKLIDESRLKARLEDLSNSKSEVEQLKQAFQGYVNATQQQEVDRQEKETYTAYPELNPQSGNFDSTFNKLVRATLTDSFYAQEDYGGRALSFKEAADAVRAIYPNKTTQPVSAQPTAEEQAAVAAAAQQAQNVREQGSAQAVSQPRAQVQADAADEAEVENLRYRTRYLNDTNALAERLKHTEHILPKDAEEV